MALCGGVLDDRHGWMFDAVAVHTSRSVMRGLPNRSETSVCGQSDDVVARLPFVLRGLDIDNGGEFIGHQLSGWCPRQRPAAVFTRYRPYRKNDQAHIEQKNYTNVWLWFGYDRYDGIENRVCPHIWAPQPAWTVRPVAESVPLCRKSGRPGQVSCLSLYLHRRPAKLCACPHIPTTLRPFGQPIESCEL